MNMTIRRIIAYMMDVSLTLLITTIFAFSYRVFMFENNLSKANFMLLCAFITICLLLIYIPTSTNGQTVGHYMMKLKVVNSDHKERTYFQSFIRECLVKYAFIYLFVPGVVLFKLIQLFSHKHFTNDWVHDKIFKTTVIKGDV